MRSLLLTGSVITTSTTPCPVPWRNHADPSERERASTGTHPALPPWGSVTGALRSAAQWPLAVVVLAHTDPQQFHRLVAALGDAPVFLHCDAKTSAQVYAQLVDGAPRPVTPVKRVSTRLSSWSLVAAELAGLRAALAGSGAQHIAVLSGADYPLLSIDDLYRALVPWEGSSWLWNEPMPYSKWDTPRQPNGGLWRVRHRFLTVRDQVMFVRGVPIRWPLPRAVPAAVELRAGTQWKIYARHHARRLIEVVDDNPDLVRFWRQTVVPDETFAPSLLASPALFGADALAPCHDFAWFMDWDSRSPNHPQWLQDRHFDRIAKVRSAPPVDPAAARAGAADGRPLRQMLFARKFTTAVSTPLLDRIDAEMRT